MEEIYPSVLTEASAQLKVEGSRFIAEIFPVEGEEVAKTAIESVRKKYFDATHHCYAYVIGGNEKYVRYSDDGEPSGTAGIKIYAALHAKNLADILVVVTRYFGGTKLGVGGLGRAYFESAVSVIGQAKLISKALIKEIQVAIPFSEIHPVMNVIHTNKLTISGTSYTEDRSVITVQVLPSLVHSIRSLLTDATRGSAAISIGGSKTVVWQ